MAVDVCEIAAVAAQLQEAQGQLLDLELACELQRQEFFGDESDVGSSDSDDPMRQTLELQVRGECARTLSSETPEGLCVVCFVQKHCGFGQGVTESSRDRCLRILELPPPPPLRASKRACWPLPPKLMQRSCALMLASRVTHPGGGAHRAAAGADRCAAGMGDAPAGGGGREPGGARPPPGCRHWRHV